MSEVNIIREHSMMSGMLFRFIKGMLIAGILSVIFFVMLSFILLFFDFPGKYVTLAVIISTVLSLFFSSFFSARSTGNGGWINGIAIGTLYAIILLVVGSLMSGEFLMGTKWLINLLISVMSGAVGGIVGVNFRR